MVAKPFGIAMGKCMSIARHIIGPIVIALVLMNFACQNGCGFKATGQPAVEKTAVEEPRISSFPGLNLNDLSDAHKSSFIKFLNEEVCPCGCPQTYAQCLAMKGGCPPGLLLAQWTAHQLKQGILPDTRLFEYVSSELNAGYLAEPKNIDTKGAYSKGDKNAPMTIVEFADFECGACKMASMAMKEFLKKHKDVQLYFMHLPLASHKHAE